MVVCRARTQTDQSTTLCVQVVEIYLERWEVLGALVVVCARALTLVLTTGLITIFILVISVIGKWSVICDC